MHTKPVVVIGVFLALACGWPPYCLKTAFSVDVFENRPIEYGRSTPDNRISHLHQRIDRDEVSLSFGANEHGYLSALLEALEISPESQTLVFSKTSKQRHRIAPRTPRALYFNDDTYVGYCVEGDILEISTADPQLGAVFYTLDQQAALQPQLVRQTDNCLLCHTSSQIGDIPGHLVRSLYVDAEGFPILSEGSTRVDHTTPLAERWGGWYVTGRHGAQRHLGNLIVRNAMSVPYSNDAGQNVTDLSVFLPIERYLTPHSDIVALMVLEHQALVQNLLTQANFTARQALYYEAEFNRSFPEAEYQHLDSTARRIQDAGDTLVKGLLFVKEASLTAPLVGTSRFAAQFSAAGPRDHRGRSLRDFDLRTRMFRYPCSYLIYSAAFDGLPDRMKAYVAGKLLAVLEGRDDDAAYAHLSSADRRAVSQILHATKPELWKLTADFEGVMP